MIISNQEKLNLHLKNTTRHHKIMVEVTEDMEEVEE
jgi:hypothetical protein